MFIKNFYLILTLVLIPGIAWSNSPFGLGQNMKKPDFAMPDKKDKKKGPHKNKLALKPYAELKDELSKALEQKDYETATKLLDAMRMVCTDTEELKNILLQLADLYYTREDWAKAERAYQEFAMLYPGAQKCDYAHFRAVSCGFKLTKEPDRDQTKTQEVLKLTQSFIKQFPKSEQLENVQKYATLCREKLYAADKSIFDFHMHRGNYKVAQRRLDIIVKDRIPDLPSFQPQAYELTIQLAQAQNNTELLLRTQLELGEKFPEHAITKQLVTDLPSVKTQLASLEKAKMMPVELPKSDFQVAQLVDGGSDAIAKTHNFTYKQDLLEPDSTRVSLSNDKNTSVAPLPKVIAT